MNMFYLDKNPQKCAEYHYDIHVNKMILESAQLLSTAHRVLDGKRTPYRDKVGNLRYTYILENELEDILYKPTHINHPVAIWVRKGCGNYKYLYDLYISLCNEYEYRFRKIHKSSQLAKYLEKYPNKIEYRPFSEPSIATNDNCRLQDAIESYRKYYVKDKIRLKKYTNRETPYWLIELEQIYK